MAKIIMFPNKKYKIIYADPPWSYDKSGGIKSARGLAKKYYTTMAIEDIKNLPVSNIADDNCYLFLWATAPNIQQALDTLEAWGFKLFTIVFTWIKINKYVLLGRKGKLKRIDAGVHSVVQERIQEHSKKPDEVRKRIIRLYGDLSRIELFARQRAEGWDSWGDGIE
mgnify:CR=1 FL=1